MPALSKKKAIEKLAAVVEKSKSSDLAEFHAELFPEKPADATPSASDLAQHVRSGLEAEEIVDLWNVVFPEDHNVWYDEETNEIRYNEEMVGYADGD
jgi:hypothetical protein